MTEQKFFAWLYHAEQGAKIFMTEDEIAAAEAQGWRAPYGGTPKEGGTRRAPGAAASLKIEPLPADLQGSDAEAAPDDGVATDKAQFAMAQAVTKKPKKK